MKQLAILGAVLTLVIIYIGAQCITLTNDVFLSCNVGIIVGVILAKLFGKFEEILK